ncbi:Rieske (2Fe-2S) protein (plasmid) [Streptomyces sp. BHT-5-2]|uniref:Rieske 2Fe-2S domain-containing protein n=1 Tax=Streptomyces sp. BHT-5-2 TaxID=2866715 RepID=UPI001C8CF894|nr:Rieske 2Fe-2S domain-containing protein [Streptomyces sp. BHT-5-2]QZL07954.1 Rieske (2Fe-2S) protein [Streptomyces sp. BHT-5-2]
MSMTPQAPFPDGWFAVAFSSDLRPGRVRRSRIAGSEVVVYRTRSGLVRVTDPHCPHLGAHLGHGGRVEGERLVCPFHGFAFDADGTCVATGYGTRPPRTALRLRHSQEANGFVFVWQHHAGLPPQWELPCLSDNAYPDTVETSHCFRGHPDDPGENSVDLGHFAQVHRITGARPVHALTTDLHRAELTVSGTKTFGRHGIGAEISYCYWGLGFTAIDTHIPRLRIRGRVLNAVTVTSPGQLQMRTRISTALDRRRADSGRAPTNAPLWDRLLATVLTRAGQPQYLRDIRQDIRIWHHKSYLERPRLAEGDGPITAWRRWTRQFYPTT